MNFPVVFAVPRFDRYLQTEGEVSSGGMIGCGSDGATSAGEAGCVSGADSPLPYIVAGLVAMVLLIVLSMCILVYSFLRKHYGSESVESNGNSPQNLSSGPNYSWALLQLKAQALAFTPDSCESDKLMVIMAGDEKPTFLASPVSSTARSTTPLESFCIECTSKK
ncbi:hypothetical protein Mapa_002167 [Marchantia paleacea]|nr:hypothetical protein Mapa_002167 [Marchantia paleacea]